MDEIKGALASKTVWAALIGMAASLLGLGLDAADVQGLADHAVQAVEIVAYAAAIYGRVTATARIA